VDSIGMYILIVMNVKDKNAEFIDCFDCVDCFVAEQRMHIECGHLKIFLLKIKCGSPRAICRPQSLKEN
jgi:hypothetical protein